MPPMYKRTSGAPPRPAGAGPPSCELRAPALRCLRHAACGDPSVRLAQPDAVPTSFPNEPAYVNKSTWMPNGSAMGADQRGVQAGQDVQGKSVGSGFRRISIKSREKSTITGLAFWKPEHPFPKVHRMACQPEPHPNPPKPASSLPKTETSLMRKSAHKRNIRLIYPSQDQNPLTPDRKPAKSVPAKTLPSETQKT